MNKSYEKYGENEICGSISELMLLYLKNQKIGYIHSIFKSSLNVRFGENLIHISGDNKGLTCFGCCITGKEIKNIILNAGIDDIVIKKGDNLLFYTNSDVREIDISKLKKVNLKIDNIKISEKVLEEIFNHLKNINFEEKTGIENEEVIKWLQDGISEESQRYLTGRGKGLTPSGDDILVGFALIQHLYTGNVELKYGDLTTDISRQYFKAFNESYINQYLIELFSGNIKKTICNITQIGHTSGYDLLFGIFLGIKKFLKWRK